MLGLHAAFRLANVQPFPDPDPSSGSSRRRWDVLPVPAVEVSSDAQVVQVNLAFGELTGLNVDAAVGTGWFAALSPDRRPALFVALAQERDFDLEIRLLRSDGSKAWVQLRARWMPTTGTFLCLLHDITQLKLAELHVAADNLRLRLLADNLPVLIAYYVRSGFICTYANQQYAKTFGLDSHTIVGRTLAQIVGADAAAQIMPHVDIVLALRRTVSYERQLPGEEGAPRWIAVSLVPHPAADGTIVGAFVMINDISAPRRAELAARESEARLSRFMEASVEGIVFHRDGKVTDVNRPLAQLVGLAPADLIGRAVMDYVAPAYRDKVLAVIRSGQDHAHEIELMHANGSLIAVECISRVVNRDDGPWRMVIVRDLRDRRGAEARIRHQAHHDALTDLPNRAAFMAMLEAALSARSESSQPLALMFIDLDRFKRINDSLGHLAGDAVLRAVARALQRLLPAGGAAGRFGGDEFVVMVPVAQATAVDWAQGLLRAIESAVGIVDQSVTVTPTIGVACAPHHGRTSAELLHRADLAMYAGKSAGRARVSVFKPWMVRRLPG